MAGYSGKPVAQKLGIKPGFCIFADSAPRAYDKMVGPLPSGASVQTEPKPPLDMVHLFVTQAAGLAAKLRGYLGAIAPDGVIWGVVAEEIFRHCKRSQRCGRARRGAAARCGRHQGLRYRRR